MVCAVPVVPRARTNKKVLSIEVRRQKLIKYARALKRFVAEQLLDEVPS